MDMELIHLRVNCLPTVNIVGAYLDTAQTVAHATLVQKRLEEKMESLTKKGEGLSIDRRPEKAYE